METNRRAPLDPTPQPVPGASAEPPWGNLARLLPELTLCEPQAVVLYRQLLDVAAERGQLTPEHVAELAAMAKDDGVPRAVLGLADKLMEQLEGRERVISK